MAVTFENFHLNTFAEFVACDFPERNPDFISESGSRYWFEGDSVIRESNHWGVRIASCSWFLKGRTNSPYQAGICKLENFMQLNGKRVHLVHECFMKWVPRDAQFVFTCTNGDITANYYAFEGEF